MDIGDGEKSLFYARAALRNTPNDPGLKCNLALAFLIAGRPDEALNWADQAHEQDPTDQITLHVRKVVRKIADGKLPCPRTMTELDKSPYR